MTAPGSRGAGAGRRRGLGAVARPASASAAGPQPTESQASPTTAGGAAPPGASAGEHSDSLERRAPYAHDTPVFVISVAAELAGMHAQTLRSYDREGLVSPGRSSGGGRRYSQRDIELLQQVQRLSQDAGVNRAGIRRIMELETEVDDLRVRMEDLAAQVAELRQALRLSQADAANAAANAVAGLRRDLVPWRRTGTAIVTWRPSGRTGR
jgi:MerR family transcriptional regulator, heat shock protein HspR